MTAADEPTTGEAVKCAVVNCPDPVTDGIRYCEGHWTIEAEAIGRKRGWLANQPAYGHFGGGCYS